jgi:hypothetical protein
MAVVVDGDPDAGQRRGCGLVGPEQGGDAIFRLVDLAVVRTYPELDGLGWRPSSADAGIVTWWWEPVSP